VCWKAARFLGVDPYPLSGPIDMMVLANWTARRSREAVREMGILSTLLRRMARSPKPLSTAAEILGTALALQFAPDHRFDITTEQFRAFASNIDPRLHGLVERWTLFYLAWVTLEAARVAYGDEFRREVIAMVHRGLAYNSDRVPNVEKVSASMKFWF